MKIKINNKANFINLTCEEMKKVYQKETNNLSFSFNFVGAGIMNRHIVVTNTNTNKSRDFWFQSGLYDDKELIGWAYLADCGQSLTVMK